MYDYIATLLGTLVAFVCTILLVVIIIKFSRLILKTANILKIYRREYSEIEELKNGSISLDDLHNLSPSEFEHWCATFLEKEGYIDIVVTSEKSDGGKDIICKKCDETYYIECKRYSYSKKAKHFVDIEVVRKLLGSMEGDGVTNGIIITSGIVTHEALEYSNTLPSPYSIDIYDGKDLIKEYNKIKSTSTATVLS